MAEFELRIHRSVAESPFILPLPLNCFSASAEAHESNPDFKIRNPQSFNRQAHLPGSAFDRANGALEIRGVQVGHFGLSNFFELGP